ncbi:MAG TPA: chaplin [Streptomyces sp.]|jgi:hypothetical protein|nr:chaplin [Streptomyces sp.]
MRQVTRKGLITVAAASGVLAAFSGGTAFADSATQGAASGSGVLSGNNIQAPIDVPVNVCGNTVSVVGMFNPASGVSCGGGSDTDTVGSGSSSSAQNPGSIGSGNNVQAPVNVPVNVCGNGVSALTASSPAGSADCGDDSVEVPDEPSNPGNPNEPGTPDNPGQPPTDDDGPGITPAAERAPETTDVRAESQPEATGELAQTGADTIGIAAPLSVGLLIGGFVLYRRARVASQR